MRRPGLPHERPIFDDPAEYLQHVESQVTRGNDRGVWWPRSFEEEAALAESYPGLARRLIDRSRWRLHGLDTPRQWTKQEKREFLATVAGDDDFRLACIAVFKGRK